MALQSPAVTAPGRAAAPRLRLRGAHLRRGASQVLVVAGGIGLWQLAVSRGWVPPAGVPAPAAAFARWLSLLPTADYWMAVGHTLAGWALGLGLSFLLGAPLGIAIGMSRFATRSTRLAVDFLRTVPPVALVPLVLLVLGPTLAMKLTLIVSGAVWPLLVQGLYASQQVDPVLRDVARVFRLPPLARVRWLLAPSVTPFIATGVRIAATMALLLSITGEYIGGAPGIGARLAASESAGNLPEMYAYVLTAATIGVLVNALFVLLQRGLLWWHPSVRAQPRA